MWRLAAAATKVCRRLAPDRITRAVYPGWLPAVEALAGPALSAEAARAATALRLSVPRVMAPSLFVASRVAFGLLALRRAVGNMRPLSAKGHPDGGDGAASDGRTRGLRS